MPWWHHLPYGGYGVLGGALCGALMRGGGGLWSWYWGRTSTLRSEAERRRRNAASAERMAKAAEGRHARANADLRFREWEQRERQQQRLRSAFRDAGRGATEDLEMSAVMSEVDLGDATTPPPTPSGSQAANGEET